MGLNETTHLLIPHEKAVSDNVGPCIPVVITAPGNESPFVKTWALIDTGINKSMVHTDVVRN